MKRLRPLADEFERRRSRLEEELCHYEEYLDQCMEEEGNQRLRQQHFQPQSPPSTVDQQGKRVRFRSRVSPF